MRTSNTIWTHERRWRRRRGGEGGDKTVLKLQKIDKGRIFARIRSAVLLGGVHVVWQGLAALVKFTHGNNYITILQ